MNRIKPGLLVMAAVVCCNSYAAEQEGRIIPSRRQTKPVVQRYVDWSNTVVSRLFQLFDNERDRTLDDLLAKRSVSKEQYNAAMYEAKAKKDLVTVETLTMLYTKRHGKKADQVVERQKKGAVSL